MEADPATARPQLNASSPPPFPAPAVSPPQQQQVEEERGAVECADPPSPNSCAGAGPNPPPPPSPASAAQMPQQPKGVEAVVTSEVEQEEEEAVAGGEGESLRSFLEDLGDQGNDCLIPSPRLKEIATPDRPAVLRFLGGKYNSLMERYKRLVAKCVEECAPRYDGLKKYTDECAERCRLYNELIELRGNIRVFYRCRPLSADEVSRGCSPVFESDLSQETELQFVPSEKERNILKFDRVFRPGDDQEAVFAESLPVVRFVMDGFNVCIFTYGQTGTGKTFTMEGVPENRGVNYRALEELFRMSEEKLVRHIHIFSEHLGSL